MKYISPLVIVMVIFSVSVHAETLRQSTIVIEKNAEYRLEAGTQMVVLDRLVMKKGSKLIINRDVNLVKLEIGEFFAANNTVIDASAESKGANGANGRNASGQPHYGRTGYPGGDGAKGEDGKSALPVLQVVAGIKEIKGLTIRGSGGDGGNGGNGGNGAIGGGYKCSHTRGRDAGRGGDGGDGGDGGNGGDGTQVVMKWWPVSGVTVPSSPTGTPVNLTIVVKGGSGGSAGAVGNGGPSHQGDDCGIWEPSQRGGPAGSKGNEGKPGVAGDTPRPRFIQIDSNPFNI